MPAGRVILSLSQDFFFSPFLAEDIQSVDGHPCPHSDGFDFIAGVSSGLAAFLFLNELMSVILKPDACSDLMPVLT